LVRRWRVARTDRGAIAVEAALVTPLLVVLVFGTLEFSSAVRAGARVASAQPGVTDYADNVAERVTVEATALDPTTIVDLWVYEARADGTPQTSGAQCLRCASYTWDRAAGAFVSSPAGSGSSWPASQQNACPGDPDHDTVGVQLRIRHEAVTGLFFDTYQVTERAVVGLEPAPLTAACQS
jgi:Flp pilus assembly protein TadG